MTKLSISRAWAEARTALVAQRRLLVPLLLGMVLLPTTLVSLVQPQVAKGTQPEPGLWTLVALIAALMMLTAQLAVILLVNGWRGSLGQAILRALKRLPILFLSGLIVGIVVLVVGSLALSAGGGFDVVDRRVLFSPNGASGWLVIILLAVLAIALSVKLVPLTAVVAEDDAGPIASLKASWDATRGHFWRLVAVLVVVGIAFLVVAGAVGAVVGSLTVLLLGQPKPFSLSMLVLGLANGAVQALLIGCYSALLARIWAQIKVRGA